MHPHLSSSGAGNGLGGHISVWSPGRDTCLQRLFSAWVGWFHLLQRPSWGQWIYRKHPELQITHVFAGNYELIAVVSAHAVFIRTELFKLNHRDVKLKSHVAGRCFGSPDGSNWQVMGSRGISAQSIIPRQERPEEQWLVIWLNMNHRCTWPGFKSELKKTKTLETIGYFSEHLLIIVDQNWYSLIYIYIMHSSSSIMIRDCSVWNSQAGEYSQLENWLFILTSARELML